MMLSNFYRCHIKLMVVILALDLASCDRDPLPSIPATLLPIVRVAMVDPILEEIIKQQTRKIKPRLTKEGLVEIPEKMVRLEIFGTYRKWKLAS